MRNFTDFFGTFVVTNLCLAIMDSDNLVSGFDVGNNVREDAGQNVTYRHLHLIPRRKGDVDEP